MRFVYSSLRESATTFAIEILRLVRGVTFDLLLLGTVLSTMRLILHAFEHTPLLNNFEEEFGNRSSFESQRVRVQANMADLNSVLAQGEKNDRCASSAFHIKSSELYCDR